MSTSLSNFSLLYSNLFPFFKLNAPLYLTPKFGLSDINQTDGSCATDIYPFLLDIQSRYPLNAPSRELYFSRVIAKLIRSYPRECAYSYDVRYRLYSPPELFDNSQDTIHIILIYN